MEWVVELFIYTVGGRHKRARPRLPSQSRYHKSNITFPNITFIYIATGKVNKKLGNNIKVTMLREKHQKKNLPYKGYLSTKLMAQCLSRPDIMTASFLIDGLLHENLWTDWSLQLDWGLVWLPRSPPLPAWVARRQQGYECGLVAAEDPVISDRHGVFLRVGLIRTSSSSFLLLILLGFGLAAPFFAVAVFLVFPATRSIVPVA